MKTVTIPGAFLWDWLPARESWETDLDQDRRHPLWSLLEKIDAAPSGRGGGVKVDLTPEETKFLLDEAKYRLDFWTHTYGDVDVDQSSKTAAKRLMERLSRLT